MIESFIERIDNPTAILRVGHQTSADGKKFARSIFVEIPTPNHAIIKGYDRDVGTPLFREVMRRLFREGFRSCEFTRMGPPKRTINIILCAKGVRRMWTVFHDLADAAE